MSHQKRPFTVYLDGRVLVFFSEASLGEWLHSSDAQPYLRLTYRIQSWFMSSRRDKADDVLAARYENDRLRVETPTGNVASMEFLLECLQAHTNAERKRRNYWRYHRSYNPGRKSHWHRGVNFRIVRTQNERWQHAMVLTEEGEPRPRASRTNRNMPNYWDDIHRFNENNWKSFRREQHQGKGPGPRALFKYGA